jgi:hypothetical protein
MLTDFLIIPNFFKDPKSVYDLAIKQTYHTYKEESDFVKGNRRFPGRRTSPLGEEFKSLTDEFLMGTLVNVRQDADVGISYGGFPLFHSLYEDDDGIGVSGMHKDSSAFAAVVYLNPVIPKDPRLCGTSIIRKGERIDVPYVYNTLVLYRGDYTHGATGGFGNTIETSRLSMNFFISDINLFVRSPSL